MLGYIEFTMEANPGTTDAEKLAVMKAGGVNRISFGVQSFDNAASAIGRIHNTDDVYRSLEAAQKAGLHNLSIDLMFGLPKQTLHMWKIALTRRCAGFAALFDLRPESGREYTVPHAV